MRISITAAIFILTQISSLFSQGLYPRIKVSNDIEVIRLSGSAYIHISYARVPGFGLVGSNGLIYTSHGDALLFDTPMNDSLTMQLAKWITDSLHVRIVGFVPNHWHSDCMGGLRFLQRHHVESYAHQTTIDIAKSKHLPLPAHGFRDSLQLRAGDAQIDCYYLGPAHTPDNIVVWIPSEQILFAGCMVKSLDAQDLGNIADADTIAYPETIQKVINKFSTVKVVIPGHGAWGGLELLKHTQDLFAKKNEKRK